MRISRHPATGSSIRVCGAKYSGAQWDFLRFFEAQRSPRVISYGFPRPREAQEGFPMVFRGPGDPQRDFLWFSEAQGLPRGIS